jgi:formylglycine-generating enzyme required for sulfatase activity
MPASEAEQSLPIEVPVLQPILNSHTFGFGTLVINSEISGDIYLGGNYLGSVKEDESKKFKQVPAGEYSLEFFSRFYGMRRDIELIAKATLSLTFSLSEAKPYAHDMVYIPAGKFFMGTQFINRSDHERPRHEVSLPPFLFGSTEVTQTLWQEVIGSNPSVRTARQQPVTNVSWYQVLEFCNALSLRESLTPCYKINKTFPDANNSSDLDSLRYSVSCNWNATGYRLPTEAEWEYAARCADSTNRMQFSGGYRINDVGWYDQNSGKKAQEVAQLKANAFELFDMSGNVFEWCWDWWGTYGKESEDHPKGAKSGTYRVIRGGSWYSEADQCTTTSRAGNSPHASAKDLGFRLVRNARAY